MKRKLVLVGLLPIFLLLPALNSTPATTGSEILWDTWGVPHIYAETEDNLFYAFGRAQMQNHGNLILESTVSHAAAPPNTGVRNTSLRIGTSGPWALPY